MTKKIISALLVLSSLVLFCSCIFGSSMQLEQPEITLSEDKSHILWEEIPNAVYYEVNFNGEKIIVRDSTEYYFTSGGENLTVTVRAVADGIVYKNSEVSSLTSDFSVALSISEITCVRISVNEIKISWNAVENAKEYLLDIDGIILPNIPPAETEYIFTAAEEKTYTIGLKAIAPLTGYYVDSSRKEVKFTYKIPLPAALHAGEANTKDFDKANLGNIEFLIDSNDDLTYSFNGEGIKQSDLLYDGEVLTINANYLKDLEIGEKNFEFKTEQSTINLIIIIKDTRSPQLLSKGVNFNIENEESDVVIGISLNNATLTSVYLDDVLQVSGTDYTYAQSAITFSSDRIKTFAVGEYTVKIVLNSGETVYNLYFTINVINTTQPYSEQTMMTFDKGNPVDIAFNFVMNTYAFETVKGLISEDDWVYSVPNSKLTFKKEYLSTLDIGIYNYVIRTDVNSFAISVEVINTVNACYNVRIDMDSDYPNILLKWDYDGTDTDCYYKINGNSYPAVSGAKQVRLSGISRTDTFTYQVRPASRPFNEVKTWTPDSSGINYLSQNYTFMGEKHDYYLNNQEELNHFIYYSVFDRTNAVMGGDLPNGDPNEYGYKEMPEVFIAFDYGDSIGGQGGELSIALNSISLKGSFSVSSSMYSDGRVTFTVIYGSGEEPDRKSTQEEALQMDYCDSHIKSLQGSQNRTSAFNNFAIESSAKTQSVYTTEQLLNVASQGIKPLPQSGSRADTVYKAAKDVLREIITNDMSDTAKIHAIYDWLIYNVSYDRAVLEIYDNPLHPEYGNLNYYNCFYLEGVFIDKIAVCDGFSKAFVLLCRIEGIEAVKISGVSINSQQQAVNHAWNKVRIDGEWYTVDSTWGNISSDNKEFMTHAYFMVSDMDLYSSHIETGSYDVSVQDYNYYKNTPEGDMYVESQQEFNDIYNSNFNSKGYIEIYNATDYSYNELLQLKYNWTILTIKNVYLIYSNIPN